MDSYFNLVNNTIDYIEENLDGDLSMETLASRAIISKFHFHRIFTAVAGIGLSEYISKRRLSQAARQLINTGRSVLSISQDAGFNSPESFARAFKKVFGIPPRNYRTNPAAGAPIFEKITLTRRDFKNLNSSITVNFDLEDIPETYYAGISHIIDLEDKDIGRTIMSKATVFAEDSEHLPTTEKNISLTSLISESEKDEGKVPVFWGRAVEADAKVGLEYTIRKVAASTFAVFRYSGLMVNIRKTVLTDFIRWMAVTKMELNDIGVDFIVKHPQDYRERRELLVYLPIKQ